MRNFFSTHDSAPESPLISVITVVFNAVDYIEQCIQSVIIQGFNDFEYVIIDGGSSDGTVQLIEKYEEKLSYWHSKSDRGLAHAFNQGIEHSKGRWLLFLNADDYFVDNDVLRRMAHALEKYPGADVVYGQVSVVSRDQSPKVIGGPYGRPFSWHRFLVRNTIPHQAAFTSRDFFRRLGEFREEYRFGMDYEHFLRAGPKLKAYFEPVLVAYMRDGGLSRGNFMQTLAEWHKSRLATRALPVYAALPLHWWLVLRSLVGHYSRRIFRC